MSLARVMPKLEILQLGKRPCRTPGGATVNGLIGLTCCCPHLSKLCIHFQATSLVDAATSATASPPPDDEPVFLRKDCALTDLDVGEIPIPAGSGSTIALILLRIFPRIREVKSGHNTPEWKAVAQTIKKSRQIKAFVHRSSKTPIAYSVARNDAQQKTQFMQDTRQETGSHNNKNSNYHLETFDFSLLTFALS